MEAMLNDDVTEVGSEEGCEGAAIPYVIGGGGCPPGTIEVGGCAIEVGGGGCIGIDGYCMPMNKIILSL